MIDGQQHDVSTEVGLMAFYDAVFDDVYRSAARLTRGDRAGAEDLVQEAFVRLVRAVRAGDVTTVGAGWLITTVRRIRIDKHRSRKREERRLRAGASPASQQPSAGTTGVGRLLEGLSDREQTAMV